MTVQQQQPLTAVANASGIASVTLQPLVGNQQIIVGIVNVSTNGGSCTASVLLNGYPVCETPNGNMDTASNWPPITVTSKDTFGVRWTGCASGDQCEAVFYYVNGAEAGQGVRSQRPVSSWQGY